VNLKSGRWGAPNLHLKEVAFAETSGGRRPKTLASREAGDLWEKREREGSAGARTQNSANRIGEERARTLVNLLAAKSGEKNNNREIRQLLLQRHGESEDSPKTG